MDGREAPLLVMGQRWLTEQTNELFVKNVREINVSTKILISGKAQLQMWKGIVSWYQGSLKYF